MRRTDEPFININTNTDECVRISSIRTNPIDFGTGVNKFVSDGVSKSMHISTKTESSFTIPNTENILKNMTNHSFQNRSKHKQDNTQVPNGLSRPRLEQLSYFTRPLGPNNIQPNHRAEGNNYEVVCSEADDDFEDEDTIETNSLRKNLNAHILTQGKASLFNDKIQNFNDEKNRSFCASSSDVSLIRLSNQDILLNSSRLLIDGLVQGPKNFYTSDIMSPQPKDNSIDEINDMLLDFSSDEENCFDQPDTLDRTQKIPMKEYLEISQAFEKNDIKSPQSSDQNIFSRNNEDDSDYSEILENDETENISNRRYGSNYLESLNVNILKEKMLAARLLEAEDEKLSDIEALEALQKAIFDHDIDTINKTIKKYPSIINMQDALGNTPLMLVSKIAYKHIDYHQIAKCLLAYGATPKIRDSNGWSCLDEVVCQSDVMLLGSLFDHLIMLKKKALFKQQEKLIHMLKLTPDFSLEMKWDFESSLIPFFSKLAPSDTFRIWKYNKYLRMDSTLAGFKRLSIKRRDMSLIFNPDIPMPSNFDAAGSLYTLNRTKSQYTNALQDIDIEEKKYMMYDMLKAEPLQGSFNIKNCHWHEYKGIFGHASTHKINDWETKRFDFKLDMEYAVFKKSKTFFKDTYEDYKTKVINAKAVPPQGFSHKDARVILNQLKQRNGTAPVSSRQSKPSTQMNPNQLPIEKINLETFENAQVTEKKAEASIWLARNFPMKFDALSPVIEFLSNGNNLLQKVESLLSRDEVKSLISENAFPVKIQVPITLSIKANITITKYEIIKNPNVQELFSIPENLTYIDRKDAQKTLLRTKKRMVLVNVLT